MHSWSPSFFKLGFTIFLLILCLLQTQLEIGRKVIQGGQALLQNKDCCDDVTTSCVRDVCSELVTKLDTFETQLESVRKNIRDTLDCFQILDKARPIRFPFLLNFILGAYE